MSRERAETEGNGGRGMEAGREKEQERGDDRSDPRANVPPFVWALSGEIHFPFRAARVQNDCS